MLSAHSERSNFAVDMRNTKELSETGEEQRKSNKCKFYDNFLFFARSFVVQLNDRKRFRKRNIFA